MLILQEILDIWREGPSYIFFALVFRDPYVVLGSTSVSDECRLVIWKFANIAETELPLLSASDTANIREPRGTHFGTEFAS